MKRRSLLYIVNFLVPVLLLFGLDLASFLISDSGGEKLSFEVTLLLAVTVMQLILNDILPCSSDSIPLIGRAAQSHYFIGLSFNSSRNNNGLPFVHFNDVAFSLQRCTALGYLV